MRNVMVAFQVTADSDDEAERIVEDRLSGARLLWQNDSTDIERGTLDPIYTFAVVPLGELLAESV